MKFGCYDFFAGGGMARLGLGDAWRCLMANDACPKKAASYAANFGDDNLLVRDVRSLNPGDLPGRAHLAWASFPCQDLSLAGRGRGLDGSRSSTFWPFWDLMRALQAQGRPVPVVAAENVAGAVTSHQGRDFRAILEAMAAGGYFVGPMILDGSRFTPQSRPRLFLVAAAEVPDELRAPGPRDHLHPPTLRRACESLPRDLQSAWVWWRLPQPPQRTLQLADVVEEDPAAPWRSTEQTARLLELMAPAHRRRVDEAVARSRSGERVVGALYRRTRKTPEGARVQRAEVRFDGLCGCLRTPAGGSSRQTLLIAEDGRLRSRLLSPREAARLMGVPENYRLPQRANQAYHLLGDGVVVPLAAWLERHLLRPLAQAANQPAEPNPVENA